ncbi:MAG: hypothetical protein WCR24_04930 [Candidatus Methanomethylophilaceae archaeon]
MYGIITCSGCKRNRIIDLSVSSTACPYCGKKVDTKVAAVLFSDADQNIVRDALDALSGFTAEEKDERTDSDPLSTLAYRVDHCSDVETKMKMIADGLTEIFGSFTVKDVEDLVYKDGKRYVQAMLEACMIYETEYGRYRT